MSDHAIHYHSFCTFHFQLPISIHHHAKSFEQALHHTLFSTFHTAVTKTIDDESIID